jgi:hypothetical protein
MTTEERNKLKRKKRFEKAPIIAAQKANIVQSIQKITEPTQQNGMASSSFSLPFK